MVSAHTEESAPHNGVDLILSRGRGIKKNIKWKAVTSIISYLKKKPTHYCGLALTYDELFKGDI